MASLPPCAWVGAWVNCVSTMAAKYPLQKSLGQICPNLCAKCQHSTVATLVVMGRKPPNAKFILSQCSGYFDS